MNIPPPVLAAFNFLYGDNWWKGWAIAMTFCLFFAFSRSTRRLGIIFFIGIGITGFIWNYMQDAYKQYTPPPEVVYKKKWLH